MHTPAIKLLQSFFAGPTGAGLSSTPTFRMTPGRVIIQLFY